MRRGLLLAVVLASLTAGAIWYSTRGPTGTTTAATKDGASSRTTPRIEPALADAAVDIAVPDADPRERGRPGDAEVPAVNPPAIQARMTDAHAHLQDAARPCAALGPKLGAHDQFRFGYTLTYRQGEARVSNLTIVWSDLDSEAVETCLLEKLATSWTVTDADWSTTAEDSLVGPDLQ